MEAMRHTGSSFWMRRPPAKPASGHARCACMRNTSRGGTARLRQAIQVQQQPTRASMQVKSRSSVQDVPPSLGGASPLFDSATVKAIAGIDWPCVGQQLNAEGFAVV